jgi:DNA-nicking Smr family endonuclease
VFAIINGRLPAMASREIRPEPLTYHPFKDLNKIIRGKEQDLSPKPPPSTEEKPVSDEALFREAMKNVREIREYSKMPVSRKNPQPAQKQNPCDKDALRALREIVLGERPIILADTQEYIEWIHRDYRGGIARELHQGRYAVQDTLDLHGIVVEEAEKMVEAFLRQSFQRRFRCVKIIHGRGLRSPKAPKLKEAVIQWLTVRYRKKIIAFVTARQCDGGLGALYVLLR